MLCGAFSRRIWLLHVEDDKAQVETLKSILKAVAFSFFRPAAQRMPYVCSSRNPELAWFWLTTCSAAKPGIRKPIFGSPAERRQRIADRLCCVNVAFIDL
jgi:hypothetical protein